jgi:hypothetical protein
LWGLPALFQPVSINLVHVCRLLAAGASFARKPLQILSSVVQSPNPSKKSSEVAAIELPSIGRLPSFAPVAYTYLHDALIKR